MDCHPGTCLKPHDGAAPVHPPPSLRGQVDSATSMTTCPTDAVTTAQAILCSIQSIPSVREEQAETHAEFLRLDHAAMMIQCSRGSRRLLVMQLLLYYI